MNFLQPTYLWAFVGLLVPLVIHLLSRKEGRVIRIGSIRHIRETPTRQFRSVRLNEYLLLFLRCLLLGGLVLFMSGWYLEGIKETHQWLLVEPGLESRPGLKGLMDSLNNAGYERRYLARDFPAELTSRDEPEAPDYYGLLEDIHKRRVEAVIVASNRVVGFSGPRMFLPGNVKWIEVAPESQQKIVQQVHVRHDSLWERHGSFTPASTQFTSLRKAAEGAEAQASDTIRIVIAYDLEFETDKAVILASLEAIKQQVPEIIIQRSVLASAYLSSTPDWLIWLSVTEPPSGAKSTLRFDDRPLAGILEQAGNGKYWLTARLNSEVAVNRSFALHLMRTLFPDADALVQARHYDRRTVSAQAVFGGVSNSSASEEAEQDQTSMRYLAIALLVLLALERLVAYQRKQ